MADASESRWGECPRCQEVNSQRAICCSKCGARLPWAATTSAAKPGVKTSAQASSAAFSKTANAPQNKSQAELEAIMGGAQNTLQDKAEAWKPLGTKETSPQSKKKRGGVDAADWKRDFDFWEFVADPRKKAVLAVVMLLLVGTVLRRTIFKPAPVYRVATSTDDVQEVPGLVGGGNDFVASGSAPISAAPVAAPAAGGGVVAAPQFRSVIYRVEGSAGGTQIEFANGQSTDVRTADTLPWRIGCSIPSGGTAAVTAHIKSQGNVTVAIEVDGQIVSRKSGTGINQVVTCKGIV